MIKKCTCKHKQQDEIHGAGNRVHNPLAKKRDQPQEWRCTVCGRVSA